MKLSRLYAITDSVLIKKTLEASVETAIINGAGMIQLREKNISDEEYVSLAKSLLKICKKHDALLIINDNIEVCLKSGADGVHLGQSDTDALTARAMLGSDAIIGITAKTTEQALQAANDGADYIGSGAIFGTTTKKDAKNMSLDTLKKITSISPIPVYAIGGINADNADALSDSGIYGIAVVSGIFKGDIEKNTQILKRKVDSF